MKKRLLAILMTLSMIFSMLPTVALAAEPETLKVNAEDYSADGTYATIGEALTAAGTTETIIQLTSNVALTEQISMQSYQSIILDLNGHTISSATDVQYTILNSGSLTIKDSQAGGEILNSHASGYCIRSYDTLIIQGGTITGPYAGVCVNDGTATIENATIHGTTNGLLINSDGEVSVGTGTTITSDTYGVAAYGSTTDTPTISISNVSVDGGTYGIYLPGNFYGTISLENSTVYGTDTGISHNNGTLQVTSGTVSGGECGIDFRGGTTYIEGGTITGGSDYGIRGMYGTAYISGGTITSSDSHAIYVSQGATLEISENDNSTFITATSDDSYAIYNYGGTVTVEAGTLSGGSAGIFTVDHTNYDSDTTITGGTVTGGYRGVYAQSGTTNILGGTIKTSSTYAVYSYVSAYSNSDAVINIGSSEEDAPYIDGYVKYVKTEDATYSAIIYAYNGYFSDRDNSIDYLTFEDGYTLSGEMADGYYTVVSADGDTTDSITNISASVVNGEVVFTWDADTTATAKYQLKLYDANGDVLRTTDVTNYDGTFTMTESPIYWGDGVAFTATKASIQRIDTDNVGEVIYFDINLTVDVVTETSAVDMTVDSETGYYYFDLTGVASGNFGTASNPEMYSLIINSDGSVYIDPALPGGDDGYAMVVNTASEVTGDYSQTMTYYPVTLVEDSSSITPTIYTITSATATNGSFTVTATTAEAGSEITITPTANSGYEVNTITVTGASGEVTVTDDAFIMPAEDVTITVTFKETAKIAQSITLTAIGTKTYGDTSFTLSAADYSGDVSNITYTSSDETVISISGTTATVEGAGEATITVTIAGDDTYNSASDSEIVTVAKASAPTLTDMTKDVYYATAQNNVTVDLSQVLGMPADAGETNYSITATEDNNSIINVSGLTDGVLSFSTNAMGSSEQTATYTITVTMANYEDATFNMVITTVNKVQIAITGVEVADKTYDGTAISYTGTPIGDNDYDGTFEYTWSTEDGEAPVDAGDYTLTISIPESSETHMGSTAIDFTIAPKALTIAPANQSIYRTYSLPTTFTLTYTGLVAGDEITMTGEAVYTIEASEGVALTDSSTNGTYNIVLSGVTFSNSNYDITVANGTLTISTKSSSSSSSSPSSSSSTTTTTTDSTTTTTDSVTVVTESTTTTNTDGSTTTDSTSTAVDSDTGETTITTATATTTTNDDGATVTETVATTTNETTGAVTESTSTETITDTTTTVETVAETTTAAGDVTAEKTTVIADTETATEITAAVATENGETVTAAIVAVATDDTTDVTIPQDVLTAVASETAAVIIVETPVAAIVLDETATNTVADALSSAEDTAVVISAVVVESPVVSDSILVDLNNVVVVDLTISVGGENVSDFNGGTAKISIPYTPANENAPITLYYVADDGSVTLMDCTYDAESGAIFFETGHFSYYMVSENTAISFTDVSVGAYYYDAVKFAVENGITSGTSTTGFSPDMDCSRAQIVTFLYRMMGEPEWGICYPYADVDADMWYTDAIYWARVNGITSGVSDDEFAPDGTCTRAQIVTFLYRLADEPEVTGDSSFADIDADAYYADAVIWAVESGITTGISDDEFAPDSACTRAQVVTFIYRYLGE